MRGCPNERLLAETLGPVVATPVARGDRTMKRPEQQEVTRDGITLLRWQWEMVDEQRQTGQPRCPYGDHVVVRRETRYSGSGMWCPTCRSWLSPVEAREAVKNAGACP